MSVPAISESEWLDQVTQVAAIYGWEWVHFRPARTAHGWRTPVSGTLGAGWPDLVLVRPGRVVFAELKTGRNKPSAEQERVLAVLRSAAGLTDAGVVRVRTWYPGDLDDVVAVLSER